MTLFSQLDDGAITLNDKNKILCVMKSLRLLTFGIDPMLKSLWDVFKDRTEFLIVWTVYLRDVCRNMLPEEKTVFKRLVVESCNFMVRTMRGFLNVHNLDRRIEITIENAFAYATLSGS